MKKIYIVPDLTEMMIGTATVLMQSGSFNPSDLAVDDSDSSTPWSQTL